MQADPVYLNQPSMPFNFNHDCSLDMADDEMGLQDNLVNINTVRKGEVLLGYDIGTNMHSKLFDQNDVILWLSVDTAVRTIIWTQEPRIDILRVAVSKNTETGNVVDAYVEWRAKPSKIPSSTTIGLPYGMMP